MIEGDIKIIRYIDGENRIVKVNEEILTEQEIVDLLVEYMEENKTLTLEIEDLNHYTKHLNKRIEQLKVKRDRERNSTLKQYLKWDKEAQEKINGLQEENKELTRIIGELSEKCLTLQETFRK